MFDVRGVLSASAVLACVAISSPVCASPILFAFDVTETSGQYNVQNNSAIFYIHSLIVTNSAPVTADANRPHWDWDIFPPGGTLPSGCDHAYFGGESGFCFFDTLEGGGNPIAPGESQTFFFNGPLESRYVLEFAAKGEELSFCRGVTNVPSCGIEITATPEPGTLGLIGGALGLLGAMRHRRKTKSAI